MISVGIFAVPSTQQFRTYRDVVHQDFVYCSYQQVRTSMSADLTTRLHWTLGANK